ncbi:MAG: adenosylcobinamide-GDP ribazoletransferase [Tissierellia bacterium]|nr:adenosylcobinamide-GDP ribazoletransferase [Bacillota bacterium]NLL22174.1 adenosylcobinamide-GDP ribazoletransferase [Tissierellia bacterium]
MKSILLMLSFFTRIPVGKVEWSEEHFKRGMFFFPLVGALIGAIVYGASKILLFQPRLPKGVLLYILYFMLTGGLHMDGLADSLDALMSGRDKKGQWEILKDPSLGAFGAIGLISASLLYVYLFNVHEKAVFLMPVVGRLSAMVSGFGQSHYRSEGLGKIFFDAIKPIDLVFGVLLTGALSVWILGVRSLAAAVLSILIGLLLADTLKKNWGGLSGDGVGMIIEVSSLTYGLALLMGGGLCMLS